MHDVKRRLRAREERLRQVIAQASVRKRVRGTAKHVNKCASDNRAAPAKTGKTIDNLAAQFEASLVLGWAHGSGRMEPDGWLAPENDHSMMETVTWASGFESDRLQL